MVWLETLTIGLKIVKTIEYKTYMIGSPPENAKKNAPTESPTRPNSMMIKRFLAVRMGARNVVNDIATNPTNASQIPIFTMFPSARSAKSEAAIIMLSVLNDVAR